MADESHEVVYRFTAEDEISGPMEKAEEQLKKTEDAAKESTAAQTQAIAKSVQTMTALQGIQSGLSAVTNSLSTLGLVDEETAKSLRKVVAGVQLVVGTAQAVKGVATLFEALNGVLKTTAIVSTFQAIAENPAVGVAVVAGAGLAQGAVAGYLMSATGGGGDNNSTTVNANAVTNINVKSTEQAREVEDVVYTGGWY